MSKQFKQSIIAFRKAVALKPADGSAHYELALAYLAAGQRLNALREQRNLKKIDALIAEKLLERINKPLQ